MDEHKEEKEQGPLPSASKGISAEHLEFKKKKELVDRQVMQISASFELLHVVVVKAMWLFPG